MTEPIEYKDNVFINSPFDQTYQPLFRAVVFTIQHCGFTALCSLEEDSTGDIRINKIISIINECQYGIHDISKADLDEQSKLARFNMPLELGILIGAHRFAPPKSHNSRKKYVVMDSEPFRYQKFISDLGGQDIKSYGTDKDRQGEVIIQQVRDFLRTSSKRKLPGSDFLHVRYNDFLAELPVICTEERLDIGKLTYRDYLDCVIGWLVGSRE